MRFEMSLLYIVMISHHNFYKILTFMRRNALQYLIHSFHNKSANSGSFIL